MLSGCIGFVPPLSRKPIGGHEITGRDASFIIPGKTKRAEVVRTLGRGCRESPLVPAMDPWELPAGTGF